MHTRRTFKRSAALGVATLLGSAGAVAATADDGSTLLWLAGLPNWALVAPTAVLFMGLSVLSLALFRRLRPRPAGGRNPRAGWYATVGGALVGVMVALLVAGPWQAFLLDRIANLPPTAGVPQSHRPMDLLGEADPADVKGSPKKPKKVRSDRARHAKVNFAATQATNLTLNLFDDEPPLIAVRDRVVEGMKGGAVWVGHVEGDADSQVILATKGKTMTGTVAVDGRFFEIVYAGGNTHAVREVDPTRLPPAFEPPEEPALDLNEGNSAGSLTSTDTGIAATAGGEAPAGQVIDLMVLYTPKSLANAGSVEAIETKIMNAVTQANQAYLNSQVAIQLHLVHMQQVGYTETGNLIMALSRLMGTTDGYIDEVHALRDQYGADQVAMLVADANYCGYAGLMRTLGPDAAKLAFAVVHDDSVFDCIGSNHTLAHELGHNQGNNHNIENSPTPGVYPDSYGYRDCGNFHDIMAYSCAGELTIPYFSNPNLSYQGLPLGVLGASDTARSMNAAAATVAAFRATVIQPPQAPGNLTAAADGDTVTLAWTDNADNESGYKVESSPDGTDWFEIAALGEGALGFVDAGLTPGQSYLYRVYAYNSSGNSAYSNTAAVTLPVPRVVDATPPVVKISNPLPGTKVSGTVTVTVTATDDVGLSSLKLYIDNALVSATNGGAINYSWNVKKATVGNHTIRADAVDTSANTGTLSVTVKK